MKYFKLAPEQDLEIIAKPNTPLIPTLLSAVNFVKKVKPKTCSLDYEGFLFEIEADSDIVKLAKEFREWETMQRTKLLENLTPKKTIKNYSNL